MAGYIGAIPVPQATQSRDIITATEGQTIFASSGYIPSYVDVYLNGIKLVKTVDYNDTSGTNIILTQGVSADDVVEIIAYSTFVTANTIITTDGGSANSVYLPVQLLDGGSAYG
jgi:hypothetical protein